MAQRFLVLLHLDVIVGAIVVAIHVVGVLPDRVLGDAKILFRMRAQQPDVLPDLVIAHFGHTMLGHGIMQ